MAETIETKIISIKDAKNGNFDIALKNFPQVQPQEGVVQLRANVIQIRNARNGDFDLVIPEDHTIEDALISDGIEVEEYVNDRVTVVTQYAFAETSIKKVYLPNCTTIRRYGFYGNDISLLEEFHGPKVSSTTNTSFNGNKNLKVLDLTTFAGGTMNGCTALDTLILRRTSTIPIDSTSLNGTPLASDGAGGYVYVPQSLLEEYQSNANWQQYAHVLEFRPIEGSEYEIVE